MPVGWLRAYLWRPQDGRTEVKRALGDQRAANAAEVASWRRENGASIKDAAAHFGISTMSVKRYCGRVRKPGAAD